MQTTSVSAILITLLAVAPQTVGAQQVHFPVASASDAELLDAEIPRVARWLLGGRTDSDSLRHLSDRVFLHLAAGDRGAALAMLADIHTRADVPSIQRDPSMVVLELQARALLEVSAGGRDFHDAYANAFRATYSELSDRDAFEVTWFLETPSFVFDRGLDAALARAGEGDSLSVGGAMALVRGHVQVS